MSPGDQAPVNGYRHSLRAILTQNRHAFHLQALNRTRRRRRRRRSSRSRRSRGCGGRVLRLCNRPHRTVAKAARQGHSRPDPTQVPLLRADHAARPHSPQESTRILLCTKVSLSATTAGKQHADQDCNYNTTKYPSQCSVSVPKDSMRDPDRGYNNTK